MTFLALFKLGYPYINDIMFNPTKYVNGSFVHLKKNSVEDLSQREKKMPKKLKAIIPNFSESCCKTEIAHHDRSYRCLLRVQQNITEPLGLSRNSMSSICSTTSLISRCADYRTTVCLLNIID
ncbi:hypothetical protein CUMW_231950 [Citrus unshiu]|nr:hypothetical protein CUMW_231950 [Citrus unshiu]GAY64221.1 hypothetical protein CUMW_231950 [Citrus unshiu]GAY64222.1 hypothetical protein CUMW_231950 [Citrus unshiu]